MGLCLSATGAVSGLAVQCVLLHLCDVTPLAVFAEALVRVPAADWAV